MMGPSDRPDRTTVPSARAAGQPARPLVEQQADERRQPFPQRAHRGRHRRGITARHRASHRRPAGREGWSVAVLDLDDEAAKGRRLRSPATGRWRRSASGPTSPTRTRSTPPSPRSKRRPADRSAWPTWPGEFRDRLPGRHDRRVGPRLRHQHAGHVPGDQAGRARNDRRRGRAHRERLVGVGPAWRHLLKVPYSASKAAIIGSTPSAGPRDGPARDPVNSVAPGPIDTDIMGR